MCVCVCDKNLRLGYWIEIHLTHRIRGKNTRFHVSLSNLDFDDAAKSKAAIEDTEWDGSRIALRSPSNGSLIDPFVKAHSDATSG